MLTKNHCKKIARVLALAALGMSAASALSACNTTEGVGKDIKAAGEGIEDTAHDAKN